MDSRIVAREIKNEIWPVLRHAGFTKFSTKTARRYTPEQIHVVTFSSFNSYTAGSVGCTTFSFGLGLGILFRAIPFDYPIKKGDPSVKPEVHHCHFRNHLLKRIEQPVLPRRDVWYVNPDGSNVLECLADARAAIEEEGLPWFDRYNSMAYVLELLMEPRRLSEAPGMPGSAARNRLIGHVARAVGRTDVAESFGAEAETQMKTIRARLDTIRRPRKQK